MLTADIAGQRPYVYALSQRDWNPRNQLDLGNISTHFAYDSWYIGTGVNGSIADHLVYGLEAAYEGGHTLSTSYVVTPSGLTPTPQTRDQISSAAADLRLDYVPTDSRNSRLSFETIMASGDPDRGNSSTTFNGNRPGTRDIAFNGFGLINTGLAFSPEVSNLLAFRFGGATYPVPDYSILRRMQVGADVFLYGKMDRAGGFDERTTNNRFLGWEPDFYMNWQISSDVTVAVRYGIFFPSTAVVSDHYRQFVYVGVTYGL
jgi:hypothetical protein